MSELVSFALALSFLTEFFLVKLNLDNQLDFFVVSFAINELLSFTFTTALSLLTVFLLGRLRLDKLFSLAAFSFGIIELLSFSGVYFTISELISFSHLIALSSLTVFFFGKLILDKEFFLVAVSFCLTISNVFSSLATGFLTFFVSTTALLPFSSFELFLNKFTLANLIFENRLDFTGMESFT